MRETFIAFQNAAVSFDPTTLLALGGASVLLGIIFWLAGTKFTKIIGVAAGLVAGAIGAFYLFPEHQNPAAISGAIVGGLIALLVHKFLSGLIGAAAFAIAVIILLVGINFSDKVVGSHQQQPTQVSVKLNYIKTLEQLKVRTAGIAERLYEEAGRLPFNTWPAFVGAIALLVVISLFAPRLGVAFGCSSLGVALICLGMILVLLQKGSMPLTHAYERIAFYFTVFASMVLVGIIVQMALCGPPKLKMLKDEKERQKEKPKVKVLLRRD